MAERGSGAIPVFVIIIAAVFSSKAVLADPRTWTADIDGSVGFRTIKNAINAEGLGDAPHVVDTRNRDQHPFISSFHVNDTEPPILSIVSPYSGETIRSSTVTISWEAVDYASGIDHYEITIDNGYLMKIGLNTSFTVTGLANGRHFVKVAAFDKAGNGVYSWLNFIVNTGVERFSWPPHVAEAVVAIAITITLGIAVYVLKSRYSFGIKKPKRRLVR